MNNGTFAGRCLECNGSVSMKVQTRESHKHPKVWTGVCINNHRLRLEIVTHVEQPSHLVGQEQTSGGQQQD